ncbi:MAG: hypothetical protein QUU85_10195, partial [Candidatus Eisenbacteria bacterium]|nr:hypothetical protein [Candidatus Eisenbacteria bacterium]
QPYLAAAGGRARAQASGQPMMRRGPGRPRKADRAAFQDEFREMLLRHFPSLTLAQYDRLTRMVTEAVG